MGVQFGPVGEHDQLVVVLDEVVGSLVVDPGIDPVPEPIAADTDPTTEVGQQLEPVVVDRCPEQRQPRAPVRSETVQPIVAPGGPIRAPFRGGVR